MIYTADYIVTMDGPVLHNYAVEVSGSRITGVYPISDIPTVKHNEVREFKDTILLPGLINCHAHLELGWARGLFPRKEIFSMWVSRLQKAQQSLPPDAVDNAIRLGVLESIKSGTTTIVDISNTPGPLKRLSRDIIRSIVFQELIGLDPQTGLKNFRLKKKGLEIFSRSASRLGLCDAALSIHAPYSCSLELIEKTMSSERPHKVPFTLHLGESSDEWDLFTQSKGRLFELCRKVYPDFKHFNQTPFEYMIQNNLIPKGTLAVHCNYLDEYSAKYFSEHSVSIVHCPRSREFFGHRGFPYELCHNQNINVCLGTDSLGSNDSLSLFEEMSCFKNEYPHVGCLDILKMATVNGALALNRQNDLGKIKKDFLADIIGIGLKHNKEFNIIDEIVSEEYDVNFVTINGSEVMI